MGFSGEAGFVEEDNDVVEAVEAGELFLLVTEGFLLGAFAEPFANVCVVFGFLEKKLKRFPCLRFFLEDDIVRQSSCFRTCGQWKQILRLRVTKDKAIGCCWFCLWREIFRLHKYWRLVAKRRYGVVSGYVFLLLASSNATYVVVDDGQNHRALHTCMCPI